MKVVLIQLNAGPDKRKNIDRALRLVMEAVRKKAQWVILPEVFNYRGPSKNKSAAELIPGPSTAPLMLVARAHKVFILAGSIYEKVKGKGKVYNTSALINDRGKVIAKYRKINLFKARVGAKTIDETKTFLPGENPRLATVGGFKIGMSICYDLRFPELYRDYARKGADVLCVPSSFTKATGRAHWENLLRARAIENLCYVLAPNQIGKGAGGVATYGNSMIIDPWGKILARASDNKEQMIYVDLNKSQLNKARRTLPAVVYPR